MNLLNFPLSIMKRLKPHRALPICMVAVCVPGIAMAQTDLGAISGTVRDATGAVIPNAQIEVRNTRTSVIRTATSDANGYYNVPTLTVGPYSVTVKAQGFSDSALRVDLTTSGTSANFNLNVGGTEQTVNVEATDSAVEPQTDNHQLTTTVTPTQLVNLPSSGRNVLSIATLGPASQAGTDVGVDVGDTGFYGQQSSSVIISGLGNAHASYLQDGVSNTNLLTQTANILASVEATQEATTLLNGAPARFSQPSVVDVITKSGSNSIHGTVYDFLQNDVFDATNWFAVTKPAKRYNQFGANIGAPLWHNKLFAFFDYSGLRSHTAGTTRTRVPTAAERAGDFSADNTVIYDPATYNTATGTTTQFANNKIDPSRISAFAAQWIKNYPLPTQALGADNVNYVANIPSQSNYDEYLGRVDWNISSKDLMFGNVARLESSVGSNSITPGLFGIFNTIKGTNISLAETHVFNPYIVNVFRVGYNRSNLFRTQQGQGATNYAQQYGLQNVNPLPSQWTPPQVGVNTYASLGDPYSPQGAIQNRFQYNDEVTWKFNRHTIIFGGEFVRTQFDGNWVVGNNGIYNFDGSATSQYVAGARSTTNQGNAFADLLLGFPRTGNAANGTSLAAFRGVDIAGYIQDDFKLLPNLTLNIGLRYDFDNPPVDKDGHSGQFDVPSNRVVPGTWNTNYNDWGPRVGLAYAVDSKTSIRAGYGIYYSPILYNNLQFQLLYAPNFVNQSYSLKIAQPVDIQKIFVANPSITGQQNYTIAKTLKDTSVQEYNLNIQRSLSGNTLLTIGYIGNVTRHQSGRADFNQPYGYTAGNTSGIRDLRPNPNVAQTTGQTNQLPASYNAFIAQIERRMSKGLQFLGSYTYSKALDIMDGDNANIQNIYNPMLTWGAAGFDRTNNATISAIYQLPFGKGKPFLNSDAFLVREVLGGWQLSGIQRFASGQPIQIVANNNADTSSVHSVYAQKVCSGGAPAGHPRLQYFNPACFVQPGVGQYGTARSGPRQPGINTTSLSLMKSFPIWREQELQFRADAFSVFNHPNFGGGSVNVNNQGGGLATYESNGPRSLQLALRYSF